MAGRVVRVADNNKLSFGIVVHVMEKNELNCLLHCHEKMERARERGKTQMMKGTIIIEREMRSQIAMINDTILVGMCSRHHQH